MGRDHTHMSSPVTYATKALNCFAVTNGKVMGRSSVSPSTGPGPTGSESMWRKIGEAVDSKLASILKSVSSTYGTRSGQLATNREKR